MLPKAFLSLSEPFTHEIETSRKVSEGNFGMNTF